MLTELFYLVFHANRTIGFKREERKKIALETHIHTFDLLFQRSNVTHEMKNEKTALEIWTNMCMVLQNFDSVNCEQNLTEQRLTLGNHMIWRWYILARVIFFGCCTRVWEKFTQKNLDHLNFVENKSVKCWLLLLTTLENHLVFMNVE